MHRFASKTILTAFIISIFTLTSCDRDDDQDFEGNWQYTAFSYDGQYENPMTPGIEQTLIINMEGGNASVRFTSDPDEMTTSGELDLNIRNIVTTEGGDTTINDSEVFVTTPLTGGPWVTVGDIQIRIGTEEQLKIISYEVDGDQLHLWGPLDYTHGGTTYSGLFDAYFSRN